MVMGGRPALAFETFKSLHGVQGTMITAVDLLRGLAKLAGWRCREVEGATGYLDTDYAAKGEAAIEEFRIVTWYVFMLKPRMKQDMKVMHWPR